MKLKNSMQRLPSALFSPLCFLELLLCILDITELLKVYMDVLYCENFNKWNKH